MTSAGFWLEVLWGCHPVVDQARCHRRMPWSRGGARFQPLAEERRQHTRNARNAGLTLPVPVAERRGKRTGPAGGGSRGSVHEKEEEVLQPSQPLAEQAAAKGPEVPAQAAKNAVPVERIEQPGRKTSAPAVGSKAAKKQKVAPKEKDEEDYDSYS